VVARPIEPLMEGINGIRARIADIEARFRITTSYQPMTPAPGVGVDGLQSFQDVYQAQQSGPVQGTPQQEQFARDVLRGLGMPQSAENVKAMVAWARAEGTKAANNPLATTQGWNGASNFNSVGVKNYSSYSDGVSATIKTLNNGHYGAILDALRAGNSATAVGQAVAKSPWGTGDGVLRVLRGGR